VVLDSAIHAVCSALVGVTIGAAGAIAAGPATMNAVFSILYVEPEAFAAAGIGMGVYPGSVALTAAIVVGVALPAGAFPALSLVRAEPVEQLRS
jgi:ABC-type lipoprotein release transport system permease subunit